MEYLYCYDTKLSHLDLSKNSKLKDVSLESIITISTSETTLDLEKQFPGIDVSKIKSIDGATLSGSVLSGYSDGSTVTYEYDCGAVSSDIPYLKVSLYFEVSEESGGEPSGGAGGGGVAIILLPVAEEPTLNISQGEGYSTVIEDNGKTVAIIADGGMKIYVGELMHLKINGKKIAKGKVKFITLGDKTKAKIQNIIDKGYTVKYSFYKAASKNSIYKLMNTKNVPEIIPTKGVKDKTYYYKVIIKVYDSEGNLVTDTGLVQCDYGYAKWTGKTVK